MSRPIFRDGLCRQCHERLERRRWWSMVAVLVAAYLSIGIGVASQTVSEWLAAPVAEAGE